MATERTGNSGRILTAAGIGLGALLLAEGGKRIRARAQREWDKIKAFEEELDVLVKAADHEGQIDYFAMPVDLGSRLLNAAVAVRIRENTRSRRLDLRYAFESYKVSSASARPLREYHGLYIRRMSRGFLGGGEKFDIVGEANLYVFQPQRYHPEQNLTV